MYGSPSARAGEKKPYSPRKVPRASGPKTQVGPVASDQSRDCVNAGGNHGGVSGKGPDGDVVKGPTLSGGKH